MNRTLWAVLSVIMLSTIAGQAAPAPVIYRVSHTELFPNYIKTHGSQPMTIWGAHLTGTTMVTIGGLPVTALMVVDDNTVTFEAKSIEKTVPYSRLDIVLTAAGGTITLPKALAVNVPYGVGVTAKGSDWAVPVEAVVTATPAPAIRLQWPLESKATGYEIWRKLRAEKTWTPVGTAAGNATAWTDTQVVVGQPYEYQVRRTSTIMAYADVMTTPRVPRALTSDGYISSGINVPLPDHRGTVILVVDKTIAGPCSAELALLQEDLIGDGWSIIRHDVARGGYSSNAGPVPYDARGAAEVKNLITNDYLNNPKEVKAVYLFGHVPVPYAGNIAPTGHPPAHLGAFPADVYYGDMDGVWTDTIVNIQTAHNPHGSCWNVPGDGKFDQSWVPSEVELEVGRVDFWGMDSWGVSEVNQLKNYITKSHNHRNTLTVLPRKALIQERADDNNGNSQGGWRSWPPIVGAGNVMSGSFLKQIITNKAEYLGFALTGAGNNGGSADVKTEHFYRSDPKVAFYMTYGSHHGDWDHAGNLLRAPLGSATSGLANMYGYFPSSHLHTLGLGGTFGEVIRLKQNNTTTYGQYDPNFSGGVHIALMGDPTLRLFAVSPPSALTITTDGDRHPVLAWHASTDSPQVRYYVYRAADKDGPFTRVTPRPITQTTWTDTSITSVTFTYQVKAAKLETTASGSYINTSQAITGIVTAAPNPAGAMAFNMSSYAQDEGAARVQITVTRNGGVTGAVTVRYATTNGGTATPGTDYTPAQGTITWADGDTFPKSFSVPIANDRIVELDETISLTISAPTGGATLGTSVATLTIANDDGPGVIYQLSPVAVNEGDQGMTKMTITCIRVGGATGSVSVNYSTLDRNSIDTGRGTYVGAMFPAIRELDFATTQGTLTWADGDQTPKTFDIAIKGNLQQELSKYIHIYYSATDGSTVQHPESFHNYILNDDGAVPAAK